MDSFWKTLTTGRCLHQTPNNICVYQNLRYRWLTLGSHALQTRLNRQHPERPGLSYINPLIVAAKLSPAPTCLLGLGGAGVPHALRNAFQSIPLWAVEQSTEVIELAHRYFMTDRLPNLNIVHNHAENFVHEQTSTYQHIIVDLFDKHAFPKNIAQADFFQACYRRLKPGGILAVNVANAHEQKSILNQIRQHAHNTTLVLPVKGTSNLIVLSSNTPSITPLIALLRPALTKLSWEATWGYLGEIKT